MRREAGTLTILQVAVFEPTTSPLNSSTRNRSSTDVPLTFEHWKAVAKPRSSPPPESRTPTPT